MAQSFRSIFLVVLLVSQSFLCISCKKDGNPLLDEGSQNTIAFENPRPVNIQGYSGDAMEPFISRDGKILFFNNFNGEMTPNGGENDTDIHFAERIDDTSFQYKGKVFGASTNEIPNNNELEAVPSSDKNGNIYFIRTLDYLNAQSPDYLSSIFMGVYALGSITNIKSLPNLKMDRPMGESPMAGELNFDAEIHYEGKQLYFAEGIFSGNPLPDKADIGIANENNGIFEVDPDSRNLFAEVNTDALEYAPSISTDNLELYFTRGIGSLQTGFDFGIYTATRKFESEPWSNVKRIDNITGEFLEAPSISFDGKLLYYHQKIGDVFMIYMTQRKEP
jgi:hypothetical protein